MEKKIRVLVADDQDIVRQGLQIILNLQPDITVVGEAANGIEAVALARQLQPDVALMDIKMPRMDGIEATRNITRDLPTVSVIILTTYDTDDWVFEGIRAGAQGYLLKDAGSEALLAAIRGVMQGESQLDPTIARKVMNEFRRVSTPPNSKSGSLILGSVPKMEPDEPRYEALTDREGEILGEIAQGLSNKEISTKLFLSEGTVRNYISSIMGKLHANDRTQVLVKAARRGMVKL